MTRATLQTSTTLGVTACAHVALAGLLGAVNLEPAMGQAGNLPAVRIASGDLVIGPDCERRQRKLGKPGR
jgi:hypothetical protein